MKLITDSDPRDDLIDFLNSACVQKPNRFSRRDFSVRISYYLNQALKFSEELGYDDVSNLIKEALLIRGDITPTDIYKKVVTDKINLARLIVEDY